MICCQGFRKKSLTRKKETEALFINFSSCLFLNFQLPSIGFISKQITFSFYIKDVKFVTREHMFCSVTSNSSFFVARPQTSKRKFLYNSIFFFLSFYQCHFVVQFKIVSWLKNRFLTNFLNEFNSIYGVRM
jgi:hypothetical protein